MVGTSPLILLNSLLRNANEYVNHKFPIFTPFPLFSVFPLGLLLLTVGFGYFYFFGKRLLPKEPIKLYSSGTTKSYFLKTYGKGGDIFEVKVLPSSPLANVTLNHFELAMDASSSVLAVMQDNELHFPPLRKLVILPNSMIAIMGIKETVLEFSAKNHLKVAPRLTVFAESLHPIRAGLSEAVIPPSSQLIGQEVRELHMRRNHQIHALALLRGNTVYTGEELKPLVLRSGDTFGFFCRWQALADFNKNPDFVVLTTTYPREDVRPKKMWFAIVFFLLSLALIVFGGFPVSVGLLLGAVGMIVTKVLSIDEAYASVSWQTVFLLAGLIPLGLVMQSTHTTEWLTQHTPILREDLPIWAMQTGLAVLATAFSFVLSAVGATIVLVPIALDLALGLGADPRLFALTVALASSNTFLMPTQQVNVLIAGPGGYHIKDFLRAGFGMTVLYWIAMLLGINLLF